MHPSRRHAGLVLAVCALAAALTAALSATGCASIHGSADAPAESPAPVTQSPDGQLRLAEPMGHAHNDYANPDPLHAALDAGMLSIEADVFLRDGTLYVAHDAEDIRHGRTLRSLYLDPLWQRFQRRGGAQPGHPFGGAVRDSGVPVVLMVDIKDRGRDAWLALEDLLAQYPMLARHVQHAPAQHETHHTDDPPPPAVTPGPVIVVVSGARPVQAIAQARARYCGYDGRWPDDIGSAAPAHLMPMVSMSALTLLELAGQQTSTDPDRPGLTIVLEALAQHAAAHGRLARVWATPDHPDTWQHLHTANMQLINTDRPDALADWLAGPVVPARQADPDPSD